MRQFEVFSLASLLLIAGCVSEKTRKSQDLGKSQHIAATTPVGRTDVFSNLQLTDLEKFSLLDLENPPAEENVPKSERTVRLELSLGVLEDGETIRALVAVVNNTDKPMTVFPMRPYAYMIEVREGKSPASFLIGRPIVSWKMLTEEEMDRVSPGSALVGGFKFSRKMLVRNAEYRVSIAINYIRKRNGKHEVVPFEYASPWAKLSEEPS